MVTLLLCIEQVFYEIIWKMVYKISTRLTGIFRYSKLANDTRVHGTSLIVKHVNHHA